MAVRIRLARAGGKKCPYYPIVVTDSRSCRDGRFLEKIGFYDPIREKIEVDHERFKYWKGVGALPSDKLAKLLRGVKPASA